MNIQPKALPHEAILIPLSPFIIGSAAGMVEVACNHPMWVIKTIVQTKRVPTDPLPAVQNSSLRNLLNPRLLYSGALANALSMIPATGLRIGMNQTLRQAWAKDVNHPTFVENLFFMSTAGVSASFVCGPVDLINTMKYKLKRQAMLSPKQKIRTGFIDAAVYLIKQQKGFQCLAHGLPATMLREATYTPFFLGMTPYVKAKVSPYVENDIKATITSGVVTGIIASTVTQPLDTIKTRQQDIHLDQTTKPESWIKTASKIYQEGGCSKYFVGGFWRMTRVASAISIMTLTADKMSNEWRKYVN